MDYPPRIQQLLDKYWSADSTTEEERELKNYFAVHSENTDANMAYFKFLEEEGAIEFEGMLEPPHASVKTISPAIRIMRIAAAAAVLVIAGYTVQFLLTSERDRQEVVMQDTFTDPNKAYMEAREALLLVSQKMQATQSQASQQIEKVTPYTSILK